MDLLLQNHAINNHAVVHEVVSSLWASSLPQELINYKYIKKEEPFVLYLHDGDLRMEISGEVDLLAIPANGAKPALLLDYKLARPDEEKYATQMMCYSLAWATTSRVIPQAVLCFFYDNKCQLIQKQYTWEQLAAFEQDLLRIGREMLQDFSKLPVLGNCDTNCQLCGWCNN